MGMINIEFQGGVSLGKINREFQGGVSLGMINRECQGGSVWIEMQARMHRGVSLDRN